MASCYWIWRFDCGDGCGEVIDGDGDDMPTECPNCGRPVDD